MNLEQATTLLAETRLTMEEIAQSLGYGSVSGFYKLFQSEYGVAPAAYRRLVQQDVVSG